MSFVIGPVADGGHLAAAEDGTVDARDGGCAVEGGVFHRDVGVGHTSSIDVVVVLDVALARTEYVAGAVVGGQQCHTVGVAYDAARHPDECCAVVDGVVVVARNKRGVCAIDVDTGEGSTSAAEEGAEDGAARHGEVGVAAHTATGDIDGVGGWVVGSCHHARTAATAEDVAVVVVEAVVADVGAGKDVDPCVANDMAVLSAAIDVAIDLAAKDVDMGVVDVVVVLVGVVVHTAAGTVDVAAGGFHQGKVLVVDTAGIEADGTAFDEDTDDRGG